MQQLRPAAAKQIEYFFIRKIPQDKQKQHISLSLSLSFGSEILSSFRRQNASFASSVYFLGFPGGLSGKESTPNAEDTRDTGSIPGSGGSPGGGGNPLQYSCLENPMDRGAWRATVYSVAKSQTQLKRLSSSPDLEPRLSPSPKAPAEW